MKTKKIALLTLAIALMAGMQSCYIHFDDAFCMSGSGYVVTEEFELSNFSMVENQTVVDVEIVQGDEQKVVVEGDNNIIDQLQLYVHGNELSIDLREGCYKNFNITVYITVPYLEKVSVKSTGDVTIDDFEDLDYLTLKTSSTGDIIGTGVLEVSDVLELKTSSTGNIKLEAYTFDLVADITGTGDITLAGNCKNQNVEMSSTGKFKAYDFESENCTIRVSGTGYAKINVSEQLDARISGTGDIYYLGNPRINISDNGVGDLIHAN